MKKTKLISILLIYSILLSTFSCVVVADTDNNGISTLNYNFTNESTYKLMKVKYTKAGCTIKTDDTKKTIEVQDNSALTYLDLNQKNLTDTDISEIFKYNISNLKTLVLGGNDIKNITALGNLTNLEYLSLNGNNIVDITPLSNLKKLRQLHLYKNNIIDITPLGNLPELRILSLNKNKVSSFTALNNLANLKTLELEDINITDFSTLSILT